ncbi:lectin C-type domain protein [Cooperia oncophora]
MGYCYSFNGKPMKWNDAARYCNDQEKVMALTESDDDQTFYAGYIQGVLSAVPPQGPPVTGVWTSVRSVPNGSEPAWVSFPGSYVLKKQFWQVGEPNIYPNYDEVCASLQQESMFRNWMSESCDALNYVVCKRKAVDKVSPAQNISCASSRFEFVCMNGGSIQVEYASYGAYTVHSDFPRKKKKKKKKICTDRSLKEMFPETSCPVVDELFLQYRFTCSESELFHLF